MSFSPWDDRAWPRRPFFTRIIDRFNPGVTLLVGLWIAGFELRMRLDRLGRLEEMGDNALKSLLLVIPIMLVGWPVLALADRRYKLGLFKRGDE